MGAFRVLVALLCALVMGCASDGENRGQKRTGTVFLDGFGFHWEKEPHRVSLLGAWLDRIRHDPIADSISADGELRMEGGTWSPMDAVHYDLFYGEVHLEGGTDLHRFHHGSTQAVTLDGNIEEGGLSGTEVVTLDLSPLGMGGLARFTVILRGFHIYTHAPEAGYTIRGLGVEASDIEHDRAAGELRFSVRFRMDAGHVPDRPHQYDPDGDYGYTVRVHYTVIGTKAGAFTEASAEYDLTYSHCPFPAFRPDLPHADEIDPALAQVTIHGDGDTRYPTGFVAWQGFSFTLNDPIPDCSPHEGRYMRDLVVRNKELAYDPDSGSATFTTDGYFSNTGMITYSLRNRFSGRYVLVQLGSKGTVTYRSRTGTMEEPSETVPLHSRR